MANPSLPRFDARYSWRCDAVRAYPHPRSVGEGIDNLIASLTLHQLIFFYFADIEVYDAGYEKQRLNGWTALVSEIEETPTDQRVQTLWKRRPDISCMAHTVFAEVQHPAANGAHACWRVPPSACWVLQRSADSILIALASVIAELRAQEALVGLSNSQHEFVRLLERVAGDVYPDGADGWYSNKVKWDYWAAIDRLVASLKRFAVEVFATSQVVQVDRHSERTKIQVIDGQTNLLRWLPIEGAESWGPTNEDERFDHHDCMVRWCETKIYRLKSGHFVKTSEDHCVESDMPGTPTASRMTDSDAADWFGKHGIQPPAELATLAERWLFDPMSTETSASAAESDLSKPSWNAAAGRLVFEGKTARDVAPRAQNLRKVLNCFEDDKWQSRIDSPFGADEAGKTTLRETVRSLNDKCSLIRFSADGTGEGIRWEEVVDLDEIPF